LDKKTKTALIVGALAVGAYLIYRWYQNKQNNSTNSPTGQLGTNLNSTLTGLSSGPETNVYYSGSGESFATSPITTTQNPPVTTGSGSSGTGSTVGSSGGTASATPILNWFQNGQAESGSPAQFLAGFQATGQNAGQIVPGGTGQTIPLTPGESYTS
jgi:hypothetical protein